MTADALRAVLLIPEEGDPHGLLIDGPCGARSPVAIAYRIGARMWIALHEPWKTRHERVWLRALVLAWDGEPVTEGMDRLRRAIWRGNPSTGLWVGISDPDLTLAQVLRLAPMLDGFGAVAFVDSEGREVKP